MSGDVAAKRARLIGRTAANRAAVDGLMMELDSEAFMRDLITHVNRLEIETREQLYGVGLAIQNKARQLCPVDTGRLRSSIFMRKGEDFVEIGTNVHYAPHVEFGTSRMRAKPYLRPAIALAAGMFRAAVS